MATNTSAVAAAQSVFDFTRREPVFVIQFCSAFAAVAMGVDLLNHLLGLEDQTFTPTLNRRNWPAPEPKS